MRSRCARGHSRNGPEHDSRPERDGFNRGGAGWARVTPGGTGSRFGAKADVRSRNAKVDRPSSLAVQRCEIDEFEIGPRLLQRDNVAIEAESREHNQLDISRIELS
jgi:hypothetical protein